MYGTVWYCDVKYQRNSSFKSHIAKWEKLFNLKQKQVFRLKNKTAPIKTEPTRKTVKSK